MLRGDLGQPPGGWPEALSRRVLGDTVPITVRPASLLPAVDLDAERAKFPAPLTPERFASHLMYPKVFAAFLESEQRFGPVSALPTPAFFYGMAPGDELSVEIEQGKTLVIRLQAIGELEDDGRVRLFFELNGQPRIIATANRSASAGHNQRRLADPTDERQVAAPMPGVVAMLAVSAGQQVAAGDLLLTLEAMKMETGISAPRAGTIAELAVRPGQAVDAKDLLLILE
jgi:pyruvate carboxylase